MSEECSIEELIIAAERLISGTLTLLQERVDTNAPLLADDIATYLRNGELERYIAQMIEESP